MSESKWKIQGSRVYSNGEGKSYNCNNKITATELYNTLTNYENTIQTNNTTEHKLDKLNKQLIQINMTLGILTEELHQLNEMVKQ